MNLVPLAESVVKLTAVCMECFREAAYTKRLGVEKEVAAPHLLQRMGGWGAGRGAYTKRLGVEKDVAALCLLPGVRGGALRPPLSAGSSCLMVRSRSSEERTSTTPCAACAISRRPQVSPPC